MSVHVGEGAQQPQAGRGQLGSAPGLRIGSEEAGSGLQTQSGLKFGQTPYKTLYRLKRKDLVVWGQERGFPPSSRKSWLREVYPADPPVLQGLEPLLVQHP